MLYGVLEPAGAAKATTTGTATEATRTSTAEAGTARTARTTTTTTEGLHASEEVQTVDDVEHAVAGNGVILGFAAGEGIHHLADG